MYVPGQRLGWIHFAVIDFNVLQLREVGLLQAFADVFSKAGERQNIDSKEEETCRYNPRDATQATPFNKSFIYFNISRRSANTSQIRESGC